MITNCLLFAFPLTPETAKQQAALIERIAAHNAESDLIVDAESELKSTPDHDWTAAHSKAVSKLRDRKLEHLHNELGARKEVGDFLSRILDVDFHAAQNDAVLAVEDAKRKATEHLVAGGWVTSRTEIAGGIELLPIDLGVLMKNRDVCMATLKADSLDQISIIEARKANATAIEVAKKCFANVKNKALALQV